MIARARKGPVARFFEGMDPKTITLLVAAVAGVNWNAGRQAAEVRSSARAEVASVRATETYRRGLLRAQFDSLRVVVAGLERARARYAKRILALERQQAAAQASPEPQIRPETAPELGPELESEGELIGPPAPPPRPSGLRRWLAAPFRAVGKILGGGGE